MQQPADSPKCECVSSPCAEGDTRNCLHSVEQPATTQEHRPRLRGLVLVDMDNTLNDWDCQFARLMQKLHPDVKMIPPEKRLHYEMEKNHLPEHKEAICGLTTLKGFWATMPVARGAVKALNEMLASGLQVLILSAPDDRFSGRCAQEKYEWLESNFGPQWRARLVLATDKTVVKGDVLIDDKPTASQGMMEATWKHVLFCQPYNRHVKASGVLHQWSAWYDTIAPLLNSGQV